MVRIVFATWRGQPGVTADDRLAIGPLRDRGIDVESVPWSSTAADWTQFDAVVLRSCWDYHVRARAFVDWLERLDADGVRVVNAVPIVRWNLDKQYLRELEQRGFPVEPTVWVERGTSIELCALLDRQGWDEAVIKPAISASAHDTWRVTRLSGVGDQERLESMLDSGTVMVQRLNPVIRTTGEWSFVFLGGEYSHAVLKTPAPHEFRIQEKLGGQVCATEPASPMVDLARQVIQALPGEAVYARVDGIADSNQLTVMEVELIEPSLFLAYSPGSPIRFADGLAAALDGGR
ncbi:MAG: hypothetical protein P8Y29_09440 [Gemmatimonadota bacterium]